MQDEGKAGQRFVPARVINRRCPVNQMCVSMCVCVWCGDGTRLSTIDGRAVCCTTTATQYDIRKTRSELEICGSIFCSSNIESVRLRDATFMLVANSENYLFNVAAHLMLEDNSGSFQLN